MTGVRSAPARSVASSTSLGSPTSLAELLQRALDGEFGPRPETQGIAVAFTIAQAVRHDGRGSGYRNEVLSLRLGESVGSCAVEPGSLTSNALDDCVGADVAALLRHPVPAVRVAALDAYLMHVRPHTPENGARPLPLPPGDSLQKSRCRARSVIGLLPAPPVAAAPRRVLVVGVVNSLLEQLRERGIAYVPCDLKGGTTEWGERIRTEARAELDGCDAILASGMTLGNGTFEPLLEHARETGKAFVLFAQTGSAILPHFLGSGVTAVSAEPYPFFWLDGGPGVLYRYGGPA
ncbi:Rossmann-like domain-containing protein [Streptomyces sp. NPDC048639]|uniref:Rossmann-like domain-containing protein n=1 Tax=Streptomyces sp. NPDC048639 TaxID=3365581 RepID=UPI0037107928